MVEFTDKAPQIKSFMTDLSKLAGGSGERTSGKCTTCPREFDPGEEFRDRLSIKEYSISGMCQDCQDKVFG
jgi:hypothetical protein